MACLDQSGGHFQGGKQGGGAMPLIVMRKPGQGLAVGQAQPALGAFLMVFLYGLSTQTDYLHYAGELLPSCSQSFN